MLYNVMSWFIAH